ncbi:MAG: hypothetical protein OXM55_01635 [Bdellovibrionales bacterium]|nr:hypothetical protein [Bdellovibrionales bacterium]
MKKLIILLLFSFWSFFSLAKYQICSITINSSDEIEIFKKHLSGSGHFEFIELVPLSEEAKPNDTHWFTEACRKGYSCDILVISGHFGGLFFGEKHTYILPVNIMEKQSCSRSCPGLLSNVKEVFLFGCNTLAGKQADHRSPEAYLQVLLDHNMARDMAETVVAARYLPFGLSFKDQMRLVFSNGIYGFTSLSPLGKDIRQPLNHYFQEMISQYGSYSAYIDQIDPDLLNPTIYRTIGGTISEAKGVGPNDQQFQNMCYLYQDGLDKATGMQVVWDLIQSGKGPDSYSAIKTFMSENQPFSGQSLRIFNKIKKNRKFKNKFFPLYEKISPLLPYVRVQFLNFLNSFEWVTTDFYNKELRANVLDMIRRPTSEGYDYATALIYDERMSCQQFNLTVKDFPDGFYKNLWSALILETFCVTDYKAQRKLINQACIAQVTKDPVNCYQVFKSLGHLHVSDMAIINKMVEFSKIPHAGLVYYSLYGLAYSGAQVSASHQAIAYHCNNPESWFQKLSYQDRKAIQQQSILALGHLQSKDPATNKTLASCIHSSTDEDIIQEGLKALYYMAPHLTDIKQTIWNRKWHEHSNENIKQLALALL